MTDRPVIPYGRQTVDEDDIAAVVEVLRSDFLTQGPAVVQFEEVVAERVQARFAVAFANGTAALHGACAVAGLGKGDRVATSALSFVASANCARYVGSEVEFVDIDPETLNLDTSSVREGLDGLVAVHYAGLPARLAALTNRPRVVIEDAAHALGAWTPHGPVGNCSHSDMTCFSFHPVKPVTTGEGGIVTTNDADLAEALRRFRSHGMRPQPERGGWCYEVAEIGMNYRMTDMQAALGRSQMRKLDGFIKRRQELASQYDRLLEGVGVQLPPQAPEGSGHGYHLYAIRTPHRREVYDQMKARGIATQVHYIPIHHHPIYRDEGIELPNTEAAYEGLLTLPIFPRLTDEDQLRVTETLIDVLRGLGVGS